MDTSNINALINLMASGLMFMAVVIPIAHGIWRKTRATQATERLISRILNGVITLSYVASAIVHVFFGFSIASVLLIVFAFLVFTCWFYTKQTAFDSAWVIAFVYQALAVFAIVFLYTLSTAFK